MTAEFLSIEFITWCHVSRRTAARWQKTGAPRWAQDLVRLRRGVLPWENWNGWIVDVDGLQSPQGEKYHYSLIRAIPFLLAASQERYRQNVRDITEKAKASHEGEAQRPEDRSASRRMSHEMSD